MAEKENLLRFHASEEYENGLVPCWRIVSEEQEKCIVALYPKPDKRPAEILFSFDGETQKFHCRYDREQTLVPGMKRTVRNSNDEVVGKITYEGMDRSIVNEHILAQADGLQISFFDAADETKPLARCHMYDDTSTAYLRCSRDTANCFSVEFAEKLSPTDLLMTLICPIIGFI